MSRFIVYKGHESLYHWRLVSNEDSMLAQSTEGFETHQQAEQGVADFVAGVSSAELEVRKTEDESEAA